MRQPIIFCLLLVINQAVFSQQIIRGKVIDSSTRESLELANIQINNSRTSVLSDNNGNFSISTPAELFTTNSITISVSYVGFQTKSFIVPAGPEALLVELIKGPLSLKEVVITSQERNQSFTTISKIDLNIRPVKSSQEILRIIPGLFIGQHAGGGKAEQIFLRGFDLDHGTDIKISVDGMPVNMVSHAHGQGYADLHFVIPELVKNADYGLGPYYASHGNLDVAGYIDLSTFNSLPSSIVKVEAGQFNTWRGLAMIDLLSRKAKEKNRNLYVAGEYLYSDGPFESPQKFNRTNLFSKYTSPIGANNFLSIQASVFNSSWNASGQVPERAIKSGLVNRFGSIDDNEGGNTSRTNINALLTTKLSEQLKWSNQLYYSRYNFNLFSNFTFFLADTANGDQIKQKEKRDLLGYTSRIDFTKMFGQWNSKNSLGIGFRADRTNNTELSHTKNRSTVLENIQFGDIAETNGFVFAEQTVSNKKWSFNIGARVDYFHFLYRDHLKDDIEKASAESIISPKVNIKYTIDQHTQVYVKLGKGFHSNDARLVIATDNTNEILPAAYGADIGILTKPSNKLIVQAAVWYLYLQQEFVYVGDAGVVEPSGKTKRVGADVSVRYQIAQQLFADANINWTKPRSIDNPKGDDYIPLAPTFSSIGGLRYIAKSGFNVSLRYRYIKDRPANENNSVIARGYTVLDASVNYTKKNYEFGVMIENMLNAKWNEAQFNTESRLKNELKPVSELHFTPGNPFNMRFKVSLFF